MKAAIEMYSNNGFNNNRPQPISPITFNNFDDTGHKNLQILLTGTVSSMKHYNLQEQHFLIVKFSVAV